MEFSISGPVLVDGNYFGIFGADYDSTEYFFHISGCCKMEIFGPSKASLLYNFFGWWVVRLGIDVN